MVANTMMAALLPLLPVALAGVNDTVDQLRNGFTIVPLSDQVESRLCKLDFLHDPYMVLSVSSVLHSPTLNWLLGHDDS